MRNSTFVIARTADLVAASIEKSTKAKAAKLDAAEFLTITCPTAEDALSEAKRILGVNSMAGTLGHYRAGYKASVSSTGSASLNTGDELAILLEGRSPIEVMNLADDLTPIKGGTTHSERYTNLNEGAKRMNSGNKLRAALKREAITIDEVKAALGLAANPAYDEIVAEAS